MRINSKQIAIEYFKKIKYRYQILNYGQIITNVILQFPVKSITSFIKHFQFLS